jgi:flavin-dependent dehydrogenase
MRLPLSDSPYPCVQPEPVLYWSFEFKNSAWNSLMADTIYDAAIVGAGPAGATAAIFLARKGRQIILIDREKAGRAAPCGGWLSARAKVLLEEVGCPFPDGVVVPFSQVSFYNADCTKHATPKLEGPAGYLVDRCAFDAALSAHAVSLGAVLMRGEEAKDIRLSEAQVTIKLAGAAVPSRLLVLATGRAQDLPSRAGFAQRGSDVPMWVAQVETALESKGPETRVAIILGLDSRGSFGFFSQSTNRCALSVNFVGDAANVLATLAQLCKLAFAKGLMPRDLSAQAIQSKPIRSPAGWALDMDTHVGKHTLLIGDAGGFVAAASNEGIYPAMWSAKIAAEVIDKALGSPYSQDELMAFDTQWRMQIADHLRSPHTDIRFLLPLIFSNQAMADRMAAAFFFGENI